MHDEPSIMGIVGPCTKNWGRAYFDSEKLYEFSKEGSTDAELRPIYKLI